MEANFAVCSFTVSNRCLQTDIVAVCVLVLPPEFDASPEMVLRSFVRCSRNPPRPASVCTRSTMPIQHAILALCSLSTTALIAPRAATPALTRVRVETLNFGEMLQNVARQVGGARASAAASQTAGEKLKALLGGADGVDPAEIAAACADDVLYEDMASSTFKGPAAVAAYFTTKYQGCRIAVERTAGNATTGGMTWRREKVGDASVYGLRGTTYCRFDEDGKLLYVREGSEPLLKPGEATEALLKAVTANVEKEDKPATYEPRSPVGAVAVGAGQG